MSPRGILSLAKRALLPCRRTHKCVASDRRHRPELSGYFKHQRDDGDALRVFLTTSHPKMPNLILTPEQLADVIAYILSLRERR